MKMIKKRFKTSELCVKLNVPRKAFDEWVKILDDGKGKNTHQGITRYFNAEEVKKLWQIKELKEYNHLRRTLKDGIGKPKYYNNDNIGKIINGKKPIFNKEEEDFIEKDFRKEYISLLKAYREECDRQIKYEEAILSTGIIPKDFYDVDYNEFKTLLSNLINTFENISISDEEFENLFTDEDLNILADAFDCVYTLQKEKYSYSSTEIQREIGKIHKSISKFITDSVILFSILAKGFLLNPEIIEEIEIKSDEAEFFMQAIKYYANNSNENEIDKTIKEIDKRLSNLCLNSKKPCSDEVQSEIKKLYQIICEIPFLKKQPMALMQFFKKWFFIQRERGVLINEKIMLLNKFMAASIEVFCSNFEMEE